MEAIDLSSAGQRRFVIAMACIYPSLWLFAITGLLRSQVLTRFAIAPSLLVFLPSALGAFVIVRACASGAPSQTTWSRFGIYLSWGWLVPYCLISAGAIFEFEYLWPVFAVLVLPAFLFLASPVARERFIWVAVPCVALAALLIVLVVDASLVWKLELVLVLAISAGPYWSLAAYLGLYEHIVHHQTEARGKKREARTAVVVSILGVSIFCLLAFGVLILAMTGFR